MKVLVIDCHGICHRVMHAMGGLSYKNQHTGILFGFLNQIKKYGDYFKTNKFIFCWDSITSVRKKIYSPYKFREPEEIDPEEEKLKKNGFKQFNKLRLEILPTLGFANNYFQEGYEADDLIATTVMYHDEDFTIITSDEDMFQLLDFADMYSPATKTVHTFETFAEEWGILPEKWIDVKAYAGCKSDHVLGITGVGNPTAAKFIRGELKSSTKAFNSIIQNNSIYQRNLPLVKLPFKDTKILKILPNKFSMEGFADICNKYAFHSFTNERAIDSWNNFFNGEF